MSSQPCVLPPLHGVTLWVATLAVSLATFMIVLDSSIANVAIPTIAGTLGVSINEGTWVITLFAAANAISIPLTGWLTARIGQVRLFMSAIILFIIASFFCGCATSLPMLIAARILQGLVAGPLIPLSQAILLSSYPRYRGSFALALWGMVVTAGPIAGPLLGGWITDNYKWSWIFYINLPIGMCAATVTWWIYKKRETSTMKLPIDTIGLVLLVLWVGALQILLDKGNELDWFDSRLICTLAVVAVIGFVYFVIWELTVANPIIDLRLFKGRNFAAGTVAISVSYGLFFGNLVLLPQWLQQDLGYPSLNAGLVLAPAGVFAVIGSPIIGRLLYFIDARIIVTLSFVLFSVVSYLRSLYTTSVDTWTVVMPTLIQGFPVVMIFIPLTVIILSGLPQERIASAAGLSSFVRVFCAAVGTSIATTLWTNRSNLHHAHLTEYATPYTDSYTHFLTQLNQQYGFEPKLGHALFNNIATVQASTIAINDIFALSALIFILLIPLVWLTKPSAAVIKDESASVARR